jgi:hypothetical protein
MSVKKVRKEFIINKFHYFEDYKEKNSEAVDKLFG